MRQNLFDSVLFDPTLVRGVKGGVLAQTLTGTTTLAAPLHYINALDPGGGSRNVVMPLETANKGVTVIIINKADAAENLVIQNNAADATRGTIAQDESAFCVCDGVAWHVLVSANT